MKAPIRILIYILFEPWNYRINDDTLSVLYWIYRLPQSHQNGVYNVEADNDTEQFYVLDYLERRSWFNKQETKTVQNETFRDYLKWAWSKFEQIDAAGFV